MWIAAKTAISNNRDDDNNSEHGANNSSKSTSSGRSKSPGAIVAAAAARGGIDADISDNGYARTFLGRAAGKAGEQTDNNPPTGL